MNKKRHILIACCFFVLALFLLVYGAGFSGRNVIVAGVAFILWDTGAEFWKTTFKPRPFTRLQAQTRSMESRGSPSRAARVWTSSPVRGSRAGCPSCNESSHRRPEKTTEAWDRSGRDTSGRPSPQDRLWRAWGGRRMTKGNGIKQTKAQESTKKAFL
jgi:hypothetical protein